MERYAKISNGVVVQVIESEIDPDGINGEWIACGDASPGWTYDGSSFNKPQAQSDPCEWLIDIGPFFDRFGGTKMAVLTSADAGVKAILQDIQVRKWIDLQRVDVAASLAYVGSVVPAVTTTLQTAILTTPVAELENLALRKLYFP